MDPGLKGRSALITGGSQGIGFAVANALVSDRADYINGAMIRINYGHEFRPPPT